MKIIIEKWKYRNMFDQMLSNVKLNWWFHETLEITVVIIIISQKKYDSSNEWYFLHWQQTNCTLYTVRSTTHSKQNLQNWNDFVYKLFGSSIPMIITDSRFTNFSLMMFRFHDTTLAQLIDLLNAHQLWFLFIRLMNKLCMNDLNKSVQ